MKLSPLPIYLLGIVFAICALLYAFMVHWSPNTTEAQFQKELKAKLDAEAAKMPQAQRRVETARRKVEEIGADWRRIALRHTVPASLERGGIDLSKDRWSLTVDAPRFRDNMQRAVNAQLKRGGVIVESGPTIPFPPSAAPSIVEQYFNFPALKFPVVMFDLGEVRVRGTLQQITNHLKAWRDMPNYLAVTDGLALSGTSPTLSATYNLSIVGYINGTRISPPVQEGTPSATPGAAGAGPQ